MPAQRPPETLVLASASPRRRALLRAAGFGVTVRPANLDETPRPGEAPRDYVARLARAKAEAVAGGLDAGLVLGADTAVVIDGEILGKPADDAEAAAMLTRLSGRRHDVLTGVCLLDVARGIARVGVESTAVWFLDLSPAEIAAYVSSGEPRDKAGAYAIQGRAARYVLRIQGEYANVVGLPVAVVLEMVQALRRLPGGGTKK